VYLAVRPVAHNVPAIQQFYDVGFQTLGGQVNLTTDLADRHHRWLEERSFTVWTFGTDSSASEICWSDCLIGTVKLRPEEPLVVGWRTAVGSVGVFDSGHAETNDLAPGGVSFHKQLPPRASRSAVTSDSEVVAYRAEWSKKRLGVLRRFEATHQPAPVAV